ncbi:MAG: hypothetical protein GY705_30640, partial [Bacteroidetes bacterium]|nr:hypothetical protein [Bacteroidota bacterium]
MIKNTLKQYSSSFMSDSKWRKLFAVIHDGSIPLSACIWKLVEEKEPINGFLPDLDQIGENYVGDCGALNGPFSFKAIEWLILPSKVGHQPYNKAPINFEYQNIEEVKEI